MSFWCLQIKLLDDFWDHGWSKINHFADELFGQIIGTKFIFGTWNFWQRGTGYSDMVAGKWLVLAICLMNFQFFGRIVFTNFFCPIALTNFFDKLFDKLFDEFLAKFLTNFLTNLSTNFFDEIFDKFFDKFFWQFFLWIFDKFFDKFF